MFLKSILLSSNIYLVYQFFEQKNVNIIYASQFLKMLQRKGVHLTKKVFDCLSRKEPFVPLIMRYYVSGIALNGAPLGFVFWLIFRRLQCRADSGAGKSWAARDLLTCLYFPQKKMHGRQLCFQGNRTEAQELNKKEFGDTPKTADRIILQPSERRNDLGVYE